MDAQAWRMWNVDAVHETINEFGRFCVDFIKQMSKSVEHHPKPKESINNRQHAHNLRK